MPEYKRISVEIGDQSARIDVEKKRLLKFYKVLTGHRKTLAENLIDRAASQKIICEDLESYVLEHGYVEEYTNGKDQAGKKASSEMQVYTQMSQRYNQTIKQLDDMLPSEGTVTTTEDKLAAFMMKKPVIR